MKSNFTRNVLILTFGLCLGVLLALGSTVMSKGGNPDAEATAGIPLEDIRTLSEVFGKIKEHYVEEVSDKQLLENAIRGMLSGLDPHSSYLDKESYQDLKVSTTGEFGGLGIVVGMEEGFVKVISPIDDTPAAKAGIKAGDIIIRLDEKPVKGMNLDEAVKLMRGPPGTKIDLTILRDKDKPQTYTLTRDKIHVNSVKQRLLDNGFGYVRISQFQDKTGEELRKALNKLKEDNKGPLKGLVLDLRNNPGGLLEQAVEVADTFITKGKIVSIKGRGGSNTTTRNATPNDALNGAPMVVLVNGGSASASEIVAGALQDQKRAVLMGSRTFGKGSVQTVIPISNDTAIKITTARYYTPNDRSIQAEGIEPDIVLDNLKLAETKTDAGLAPVKEADLEGHLENTTSKKDSKDLAEQAKKKRLSLVTEDYPIFEALNMLKGMALLSGAH
ncbi:MAG: S41 family peptidase [Gammaproteobacteria bacterium]|nr:S41 family peptidase [Gammaproteobacteria bacterium]